MRHTTLSLLALAVMVAAVGITPAAEAATDCSFTTRGSTMRLDGDCTTDTTITIPDGMTLDGRGYTITAVDPSGGHFTGAVVQNAGATAHVKNLVVTADALTNTCDSGAERLRGIMLEGASGSITHSTVIGINQGASGCQEGNAIEVRNAPFDGTHPNTQSVEIAHNNIGSYQKTGIVANGDVEVWIHHNDVGASATQESLAANSIQLGFGASGGVYQNHIDGNQWLGASNYAATAVLFSLAAPEAYASKNNIRGNSDVGIYLFGDGMFADNNKVFDSGADASHGDFGIVSLDVEAGESVPGDNIVTNNKVRGFDITAYGVNGGNNKAIPGGPKAFDQ